MSAARLRPLVAALVLALVATVAGVATVQRRASADPIYIAWPELLPGLTDGFDPGSSNACVSGQVYCIDAVVKEMQRRYEPLRDSCSHQALFALTYLRVTQTYAWSARQPGYYPDPAWTNHAVAVFAQYYLRAFDAWTAGNSTAVPQAWKIAFDGARDGKFSGSGNFFLGLNAHINHDLALAMAAAGLTSPADGSTEKINYDRIDLLLNQVTLPLIAELSARLDPSMNDTASPFYLDVIATGNVMFAWREQAWRNAELIAAEPALTRPLVTATIDANSITQANTYATTLAYTPPLTSRNSRDAFCALHHNDPAPQAYPFGTPTD